MPVADQDEVRELLSDFETRLRSVVERAWQEWMALPDRGRFEFVGRFRAVLVFDSIVRLAKAEFAGDPDIKVITKSQTVQFLIKNKVLVRFKKGNTHGVGSNIETQAVLDFIDPQRKIPGLLPDILRVEVCYQPDELGARLEEVAVVARDRTRRIWSYPLRGEDAGAEIIPLPSRAPDDSPPIVTPRRVPKKGTRSSESE